MTETPRPAREFGDRFTVIPDSGITALNCFRCPGGNGADTWEIGYHPSLDVLIEQARAHNLASHDERGPVKDLRERLKAAIDAAWWSGSPATPAVMEVIAPLIAAAERPEKPHTPGPKRVVGRQLTRRDCMSCGHPWPCEGSWQARAERAEATVDALYEYATTYRGDPGMTLACEDILGIIGSKEESRDQ